MKNNSRKTRGDFRLNYGRLWSIYGSGIAVCIGFGVMDRPSITTAEQRAVTPPFVIQQRAWQITRALFPNAPKTTLVWCGLPQQPGKVTVRNVWAADVLPETEEVGHLLFNEAGELCQYSNHLLQTGCPLYNKKVALLAARKYRDILRKSNCNNRYLTMEQPSYSLYQDIDAWRFSEERAEKQIRMTLDARTGALLFFAETKAKPFNNRLRRIDRETQ